MAEHSESSCAPNGTSVGSQEKAMDDLSGTDGVLPIARNASLNLTPEEKRVYYQLFQAADKTNLGVITGEVAVPFFEKTMLPAETLGLVCAVAVDIILEYD